MDLLSNIPIDILNCIFRELDIFSKINFIFLNKYLNNFIKMNYLDSVKHEYFKMKGFEYVFDLELNRGLAQIEKIKKYPFILNIHTKNINRVNLNLFKLLEKNNFKINANIKPFSKKIFNETIMFGQVRKYFLLSRFCKKNMIIQDYWSLFLFQILDFPLLYFVMVFPFKNKYVWYYELKPHCNIIFLMLLPFVNAIIFFIFLLIWIFKFIIECEFYTHN